jgi:(S)-ureidoglycine aminohydrolase
LLKGLVKMMADRNRQIRARRSRYYLLHTPEAFVRSRLPGLRNAMAIIHVSPSAGAQFTQYTIEFHDRGLLEFNAARHFLYVLEGEVEVEGHLLHVGDYAHISTGSRARALATQPARATVIEIPFPHNTSDTQVPTLFVGRESSIQPMPMPGAVFVLVRALTAGAQTLEFTVNTLTYQPGATLPRVEMQTSERSILILSGGGISRLGDEWSLVTAGDFLWIGPGCPQWFGALGNAPTKCLIYQPRN